MKYIIFLLFSFSIYAQDTIPATKSVIALDKMNVVYRGFPNPISIAVNDAKSFKIYGKGVKEDENGNYILVPESGLTTKVYVEITKNDNSIILEEHEFWIKALPNLITTINNQFSSQGYLEFTLDELKDAIIGVKLIDFLHNEPIKIYEFTIKIDENTFYVNKNEILTESGYNFIKNNRKEVFEIINVRWLILGKNINTKKPRRVKFKIK